MLVFPGTVLGPLLFSQCAHLGMVWHIPVASTDTCQQPTLQKYSVSSLVLSFLSQTWSCHHLDINGSWMPCRHLKFSIPQRGLVTQKSRTIRINLITGDPRHWSLFPHPHSSGWPTPYWLTPLHALSRWERPCLLNGPFTSFLMPIADFPPRTWFPRSLFK